MKKGKPANIITTMRVDREFWGRVRAQAYEEEMSATALVVKVLADYLKRKGEK